MRRHGYQRMKMVWMNTSIETSGKTTPASMMRFIRQSLGIEKVCIKGFIHLNATIKLATWMDAMLMRVSFCVFHSADLKTVYLIMYNLYQFIAYFYIVLVLSITLSRDGFNEVSKVTYKTVGAAMKCSQTLQYLEFLNALVGYTKGSALFPFLQVTGRNFVLFAVINAESRVQEMPVVFVLFMVWSSVEVIRYPYYIISLLNKDISALTWLRYTIWIVLYPLGFLCEGTVLLRSLPFFEETKRFTIELPNEWNFTFDMVAFMKIYMGFVLLPGIYIVMKHMTKLRAKKLKTPTITQRQRTHYD